MDTALISFQYKRLRTPALMHTHINRNIGIRWKQSPYGLYRIVARLLVIIVEHGFGIKTLFSPCTKIANRLIQNLAHEITGVGMKLILIHLDITAQLGLVNICPHQVCLRSKVGRVSSHLTKTQTSTDGHYQIALTHNHIGNTIAMSADKANMKIILGKIHTIHGGKQRDIGFLYKLVYHVNGISCTHTVTNEHNRLFKYSLEYHSLASYLINT